MRNSIYTNYLQNKATNKYIYLQFTVFFPFSCDGQDRYVNKIKRSKHVPENNVFLSRSIIFLEYEEINEEIPAINIPHNKFKIKKELFEKTFSHTSVENVKSELSRSEMLKQMEHPE